MLDNRKEHGWADQRDRCNCDCNGVAEPPSERCCRGSHLRDEGIKRTSTPGVYFADADLQCEGIFCSGFDQDIRYCWQLLPISGNASIVGNPVKEGNNRVEVAGTGTFYLHVQVLFRCRSSLTPVYEACHREAIVKFTQ